MPQLSTGTGTWSRLTMRVVPVRSGLIGAAACSCTTAAGALMPSKASP